MNVRPNEPPAYPAKWPVDPMSDADRAMLKPAVIASYIFVGFFGLVLFWILGSLVVLLSPMPIVTAAGMVLVATTVFFAARALVRVISGTYAADLSGNERVRFSGTLTRIGQSRHSRQDMSFGSPHRYVMVIDDWLVLRCRHEEVRLFKGREGVSVTGACTPRGRVLLEVSALDE